MVTVGLSFDEFETKKIEVDWPSSVANVLLYKPWLSAPEEGDAAMAAVVTTGITGFMLRRARW